MKKYYEYFGLALIMVFSFYYTDKIATIVLNKNPLMVTIKQEAEHYNVDSVNAIIDGEYITPGVNGLMVNAKESFLCMQELNEFNNYFLVFDQKKPEISVDNHKDKIIKSGNRKSKKVAIVLETENDITTYFKNNNLKASMLVKLDTYKKNSNLEVINNEVEGFKSLENTLNLNKENKNICVVNEDNLDVCRKHKNYLVSPSIILTSNNFLDVKKELDSGSIIFVSKSAMIKDIMMLIREINYKDLEIVYLSELISEENNGK